MGYYTIVKTNSFSHQNNGNDLVNIFRDLWQSYIVNVNILTYANTTRPLILMHTYFPFGSHYCGKIVPLVWNFFDNDHLVQSNKLIFPLKTENLFQCPISVLVAPLRPYIFITGNNSDGSPILEGIEYNLIQELSQRLNFTLNISIYWDQNLGAVYGGNGSAIGAFGMVGLSHFLCEFKS